MLPAIVLAALAAVESGGDANVRPGDGGQALGLLQIHRAIVVDVNRYYGTRYVWFDALDPVKARAICTLYLEHWATPARLGHVPTAEDYARTWNGGPNGWRKPATAGYWRRVRKNL